MQKTSPPAWTYWQKTRIFAEIVTSYYNDCAASYDWRVEVIFARGFLAALVAFVTISRFNELMFVLVRWERRVPPCRTVARANETSSHHLRRRAEEDIDKPTSDISCEATDPTWRVETETTNRRMENSNETTKEGPQWKAKKIVRRRAHQLTTPSARVIPAEATHRPRASSQLLSSRSKISAIDQHKDRIDVIWDERRDNAY